MGLVTPRQGVSRKEVNVALVSSSEFGTLVTAANAAHTKTTTPVELMASTSYMSYGVAIGLGNVGTAATTNTRTLVDIMIGPASSEIVLIPNLMCGQAGASNSASSSPVYYYFPIMIPAGARLSARSQTLTPSDTVNVQVHLFQNPVPGRWYGSRVTAYGANTATSTGVLITPASAGSYSTAVEIRAAGTGNPIKAMQVGIDLGTATGGQTARGIMRIVGASDSSTVYVSDLPYRESTTLESIDFSICNMLLSHMQFNIAAGSYLGIGAMVSNENGSRGHVIYGVD